jgi:hypothetical protein
MLYGFNIVIIQIPSELVKRNSEIFREINFSPKRRSYARGRLCCFKNDNLSQYPR